MKTVQLWNTDAGEMLDYVVTIDRNGEVVATYEEGDYRDFLKFPGGLTPAQFQKLVKAHNTANEGIVGVDLSEQEELAKKNEKLLESL